MDHPLPSICDACGAALNGDVSTETRQVFDLPPVALEVTEHHIHRTRCACGKLHRSEFPSDVVAPVHYGAGVKALAVYLTQHHMLPVARTAQLLSDLYGLPISRGTIQTMIGEAGTLLAPTVADIADAIARSDVAGADESGYRVAGQLNWLHTAVTTDPRVPFSNNLAEQAIRMPKVKHKIAGCFRTFSGAQAFCTIRSCLATIQKQHFDIFPSLVQAFQGNVPQPRFAG